MAPATVFAALLALLVVTAQASVSNCRFKFCDGDPWVDPDFGSDRALTDAICERSGERIGSVDSTGEALLLQRRTAVPISEWRPRGLQQSFSASFFKAYHNNGYSGVGLCSR